MSTQEAKVLRGGPLATPTDLNGEHDRELDRRSRAASLVPVRDYARQRGGLAGRW
jgi:hypothetical protein